MLSSLPTVVVEMDLFDMVPAKELGHPFVMQDDEVAVPYWLSVLYNALKIAAWFFGW